MSCQHKLNLISFHVKRKVLPGVHEGAVEMKIRSWRSDQMKDSHFELQLQDRLLPQVNLQLLPLSLFYIGAFSIKFPCCSIILFYKTWLRLHNLINLPLYIHALPCFAAKLLHDTFNACHLNLMETGCTQIVFPCIQNHIFKVYTYDDLLVLNESFLWLFIEDLSTEYLLCWELYNTYRWNKNLKSCKQSMRVSKVIGHLWKTPKTKQHFARMTE